LIFQDYFFKLEKISARILPFQV